MNAWSGRFVVARVAFGVLSGGWLAVTLAGEGHRPVVSHGGTTMQHGRMEVGDAAAPPEEEARNGGVPDCLGRSFRVGRAAFGALPRFPG
jgi:hypothetical protein